MKIHIQNLTNLNEFQKLSFFKFISHGIQSQLKKYQNLFDLNLFDLNVKFDLNSIKLNILPKVNEAFCKKFNQSYSLEILVPITIYLKNSRIKITHFLNLGQVPLITEKGTFLINGIERVCINQLVRKPGVYFNTDQKKDSKQILIISSTNIWSKIIKKNNQYFLITPIRNNNIRNYPFFIPYINNDLIEIPLNTIINLLYSKNSDYLLSLQISDFLYNNEYGCFQLGQLGRENLNLILNEYREFKFLDLVDLNKILIFLKSSEFKNSEIDNLENKYIRSIGDFYEQIFTKNILKNLLTLRFNRINFNLEFLKNSYSEPLIDFFKTNVLSQLADQINPLSTIVNNRKLSLFGPNGLKKDHISNNLREIHPSQFSRICPIETSEGQSAGLISSISSLTRIDYSGKLLTPFILNLKNQKNLIKYLNNNQDLNLKKAFPEFTEIDNFNKNKTIDILYKHNFNKTNINNIDLFTISYLQLFSISTSLVPFVEHNDANRALMGANMQKQAVPLINSKKSLILSGLEPQLALDSNYNIVTPVEGYVTYISSNGFNIQDQYNQNIFYKLKNNIKSNQNLNIKKYLNVNMGEKVFKGQNISNGFSIKDNELALGRTLKVVYMPFEGYNYEDAIVINERLIKEDILTSLHIETMDLFVNLLDLKNKNLIITNKLKDRPISTIQFLNKHGFINLGSLIKSGDVLIGQLKANLDQNLPEFKLAQAILGFDSFKHLYKDTSLLVPNGIFGRIIKVEVLPVFKKNKISNNLLKIKIYIAQRRKIEIGDKLAGRHGNKGIISKILSNFDMPILPCGNTADILLNPLGVPSRMNVGQIFEATLGRANYNLGQRIINYNFDEVFNKDASSILLFNQLFKSNIFNTKDFIKDSRTGEYFDNEVAYGYSYIIKLIHLVEKKIHARSTGKYSLITEQPLGGKALNGGQRVGEMEMWALEAYGATSILNEFLSIKSDDINGRQDLYNKLLNPLNKEIKLPKFNIPETSLLLLKELNSLGLNIKMNKINYQNIYTPQENINLFNNIENILRIRALNK